MRDGFRATFACPMIVGSFVASAGRGFEERTFNITNEKRITRVIPTAM